MGAVQNGPFPCGHLSTVGRTPDVGQVFLSTPPALLLVRLSPFSSTAPGGYGEVNKLLDPYRATT